jgi:hypothetical protein
MLIVLNALFLCNILECNILKHFDMIICFILISFNIGKIEQLHMLVSEYVVFSFT